MTILLRSYFKWTSLRPIKDCCIDGHWSSSFPIPDDEVCLREQAWREYVRLRDNNPGWMRSGWKFKTDHTYYKKPQSIEEVRLMFKKENSN